MRKNLTFIVLLLIAITINIKAQDLNSGLVAYYPFNGNANDVSGYGNNGSVNGASLTTDIFGKTNSAYSFDGINDYIEIPHNDAINLTGSFSMSVQFKTSYALDYAGILVKANPLEPRTGYIFCIDSGDSLNGQAIYDHPTAVGSVLKSSSKVTDGRWHTACFTYNGSVTRLYIDGKLLKEQAYTSGMKSNTEPLLIGWDENTWLSHRHFEGTIDEVRLYNRALTETEAKSLTTSQTSNVNLFQRAKFTANPPKIDGKIDSSDPWNSILPLRLEMLRGDSTGFSAYYQMCYDKNNIYVVVTSNDATPNNDNSVYWENDCIELFFSLDTTYHTSYNLGDYQIRKIRGTDGYSGMGNFSNLSNDINFSVIETNTNTKYIQEWKIPFSALSKDYASWDGNNFRFDVQVIDNTLGAGRTGQLFYFSNSDQQWTDPSYEGIIGLKGNMQSIDFTKIPNLIYGAKDIELEASASSELEVKFFSSDTSVISIKNGLLHTRKPGYCHIIAKQEGNDTLAPAIATQYVKVEKAPLYVLADNKEMLCGHTVPKFTYSYFGFVNGDDEADLLAKPIATSKASKTAPIGKYTITLSGAYALNYELSYVNGQLIIKPLSSSNHEVVVCKDSTYKLPSGKIVRKEGTYNDSLKTANGCDSIAIFKIAFVIPMNIKKDINLCEGKSYIAGGAAQTKSGVYYDTIVSSVGCDSLYIITNLKIEPNAAVDAGKDFSICGGDTITITAKGAGKVIWQGTTENKMHIKPGKTTVYKAVSSTQCGNAYDDVKVTVVPKPEFPVIQQNVNTLYINTLDKVKWYSSDGIIPDANSWSYYATKSGKYYAVVNNDGCSSDTSNYFVFKFTTSVDALSESNINLYPNPVNDYLKIESNAAQISNIEVIDIEGRVMLKANNNESLSNSINLTGLAKGVYVVKIYSANKLQSPVSKMIIKN